MSRELAQLVQALRLAHHGQTEIVISLAAGGSESGQLVPSEPYFGLVLYSITFGDIISGIFELTCAQSGYTRSVKTIDSDDITLGESPWLYIIEREPFRYEVKNTDSVARTFRAKFDHLNVSQRRDFELIKLVAWEYVSGCLWSLLDRHGMAPPLQLPPKLLEDLARCRWAWPTPPIPPIPPLPPIPPIPPLPPVPPTPPIPPPEKPPWEPRLPPLPEVPGEMPPVPRIYPERLPPRRR